VARDRNERTHGAEPHGSAFLASLAGWQVIHGTEQIDDAKNKQDGRSDQQRHRGPQRAGDASYCRAQ
jgi:hypothetical protein